MELVLIEWQDSLGCSSNWQPLGDCAPEPFVCRSVGWLLYDGKDTKVVVPHIHNENESGIASQGCGDIAIPSRSILRMVKLTIPKARIRKGVC